MPRPTETKQTDIEQALQYTIDQVFKELYSAEVIERAKQTYYRVYTPTPPEHLRFYTPKEALEKAREEQVQAFGLIGLKGEGIQKLFSKNQIDIDQEEENGPSVYYQLKTDLAELMEDAEDACFREAAYQKYGWEMERSSSGVSITYDPGLAPPGQEVNFAKQAITLFVLYQKFAKHAKREEYLSDFKEQLRLNKADLSPDITELSKECHIYIRERVQKERLHYLDEIEKQIAKKEQEVKERERSLQKKTGKYRKASHLVDNILRRGKRDLAPTLFDSLTPETRRKIEAAPSVIHGIELSKGEKKVIDVLCKLLHQKSPNTEKPKEPGYYIGDTGEELATERYASSGKVRYAQLTFSLHEVAKAYRGGENPSGADIKAVEEIVNTLEERRYLISYRYQENGRYYVAEAYEPLMKRVDIYETNSKGEKRKDAPKKTVVRLNPIFTHQIETKYVSYPENLRKRVKEAYGSHNISDITLMLIEMLARDHANKRFKKPIGIEKLHETVAAKALSQGRRKYIEKHLSKACQVCKDIGLLKSYTFDAKAADGSRQAIFYLHNKWE